MCNAILTNKTIPKRLTNNMVRTKKKRLIASLIVQMILKCSAFILAKDNEEE